MKKVKPSVLPSQSSAKLLMRLLKYMKPYGGYLFLTLIFSVIQVLSSLLIPVFIGKAIDNIIGRDAVNFIRIFEMIIYIIICVCLVIIFQWLGTVCANKISFSVIKDIRDEVFKKLNCVPLKYIDASSHGDLMSRIVTDCDLISDGLISGFTQIFTGLITIGGTVGLMLSISVPLALIALVLTPLSIFAAWFIAKGSRNKFRLQAAKRGELSGLTEELIANQGIVKAFNYESRAEKRFEDINADLKKYGGGAMFFSSITNPTARIINMLVYSLVAVFGAIIIIKTPLILSVGGLTSLLAYSNQYSKPFNEITGIVSELQSAFSSLRRVTAVLDEKEEVSDKNLPALALCDGSVKFENVNFSYLKEKPLITGFNLNITKGKRVAIVGPTGCGKTTLINLLMRFYDADSGTITVSDKNITQITRSSLRRNYGMILQESWLFKGTIRDNISYGKPDATQGEIEEAAKKAHIHNFIMRTEKGYDSIIFENGGNISQGQKQLLCIARIMLTSPPMLILDEATSNIDTRTELLVQRAFLEMMKDRTSFIIAHRLSTIMDADLILVMKEGNIVESGTHNELLSKNGFYAYLYNSQFSK